MEIMTLEEFKAAIKSQNVPIEQVTFECPRCKTLQCGNDLIKAGAGKDFDDIEKYLGFSCVGRWDKNNGCDWTLGGLFQLHDLEVVTPDGKHHPRFKPVDAKRGGINGKSKSC
jgi:hypothetical protein